MDRKQRFTEQIEQCHRQLLGYIFALVRNLDDSQDVFQQTTLVLWEKFDEFEPGTNFAAWACTVARYKVRSFLRGRRRHASCLSDVFAEKLAAIQANIRSEEIDARRLALSDCVQKLMPQQRELLDRRYGASASVAEMAQEFGRPARSLHNSLRKVREVLLDCIDRTIARDSRVGEPGQ